MKPTRRKNVAIIGWTIFIIRLTETKAGKKSLSVREKYLYHKVNNEVSGRG